MSKISEYVDGGTPQNTDYFVVARAGDNFKILWSNIKAALDLVYAAIANEVTNGDAHDHNGGDGAQINHTTLSNIGNNTHAQIDTHLALPHWTVVRKTANESTQSDTTLTNDSELIAGFTATKTYAFRGRIFFTTTATADFKFRFNCGSTVFNVKYTSYPPGSTTGTVGIDTSAPGATVSVLGTGTSGGYIEFDGIVTVDGSDRTWAFAWAQNTSQAANTTVLAGSYLEYYRVD